MKRAAQCLVLLQAILLPLQAFAQENGIFADFTTSLGNFTCRLEPGAAPQATANFIGLATGQQPWLDETTGRVRTGPFYNGLTFHRVVTNFMIQGGSPNALGNDGPGYVFPDEFDPALRHDGPGILSMANSGPKSNGSQFFITVASTPWLDDVHTIFGRVVSGQDVVNAISLVPTTNSAPLTPVTIQSIAIRRVGSQAEAFDIRAQNLPLVSRIPLAITAAAGEIALTYSNRQFAAHYLSISTNLVHWSPTNLGIELAPPSSASQTQPIDVPTRFYTVSQVQYPSSTFAPAHPRGRTLRLSFQTTTDTLTLLFDAAGGGTYDLQGPFPGTGAVSEYVWNQEPYRAFLWPIYFDVNLYPMTLQLDFAAAGSGSFSGTVWDPPFPLLDVEGSFTLSPP